MDYQKNLQEDITTIIKKKKGAFGLTYPLINPEVGERMDIEAERNAFGDVPLTHRCGNYLDNMEHKPIPDGSRCCWRHGVGLPKRWGLGHPYYPWQEQLEKENGLLMIISGY